MTKTCEMPATWEVNATVWPSGEIRALFMGLSQRLICVIFAGPLGALEPRKKRYAANAAMASTRTAHAITTAVFFPADAVEGRAAVVAIRLLPLPGSRESSWTVLVSVEEIRPDPVSRRRRFKSV